MSAFQVDLEELDVTVAAIAAFEQQLVAAISAADREVERLHADWTGAAADAHREAHERWRRGAREMAEALAVMRRIAHGAHGNYSAAVAANVSMWAAVAR